MPNATDSNHSRPPRQPTVVGGWTLRPHVEKGRHEQSDFSKDTRHLSSNAGQRPSPNTADAIRCSPRTSTLSEVLASEETIRGCSQYSKCRKLAAVVRASGIQARVDWIQRSTQARREEERSRDGPTSVESPYQNRTLPNRPRDRNATSRWMGHRILGWFYDSKMCRIPEHETLMNRGRKT